MKKEPRVAILQRKAAAGQFSIERSFALIIKEMRALEKPVHLFEAPVTSSGLLNRLRILAWAYSLRADVLHISGDIMFAALATNPSRTIVTVHDCEVLRHASGLRRWMLGTFWFRLPLARAAEIAVISRSTEEALREYFPGLRHREMHVIPTAVPEIQFNEPREDWGDCPRILQIGTKKNKNLSRLFDALAGLKCELVIVGNLSKEQRSLLEDKEIIFQNRVNLDEDELHEEYRRADIVTLVSLQEGFGMPILEAQRVGRPVVTSSHSSMPEVAGEGALLVDAYDPEAIRAAIERLMREKGLRESLIAKGRANAERFKNCVLAEKYWSIYLNFQD